MNWDSCPTCGGSGKIATPELTEAQKNACDHVITLVRGVMSNLGLRPGQKPAYWKCKKCGARWHWDCPPSTAERSLR